MNWRSYLQTKTRQPAFLWRLSLGILAAGAVLGWLAQAIPDPLIGALGADFSAVDDSVAKLDRLAEQGDWLELWWSLPQHMWLGVAPAPAAIAAITGMCWLVFMIQAGQPGAPGGIRWWLAPVAVVLGIASIWPTLFAIFWQEQAWQLRETPDLAGGLRFFILGVGLREELAKLLLFLPLVPWIVRRGSEREALLLAACVGLGFAVEENVGYFSAEAGSSVGRFLTANFFHMSLTGLAGLAVCRGIWHPRERAAEAATIVLLAIIIHGVYDALIVLPAFSQYAMFSIMLYILVAYQFFHELRSWWQPRGETISLTATFLASVSLVVAVSFVYLSAVYGFQGAIQQVAIPAVNMGVMVYVFLREVPESIIDV